MTEKEILTKDDIINVVIKDLKNNGPIAINVRKCVDSELPLTLKGGSGEIRVTTEIPISCLDCEKYKNM